MEYKSLTQFLWIKIFLLFVTWLKVEEPSNHDSELTEMSELFILGGWHCGTQDGALVVAPGGHPGSSGLWLEPVSFHLHFSGDCPVLSPKGTLECGASGFPSRPRAGWVCPVYCWVVLENTGDRCGAREVWPRCSRCRSPCASGRVRSLPVLRQRCAGYLGPAEDTLHLMFEVKDCSLLENI